MTTNDPGLAMVPVVTADETSLDGPTTHAMETVGMDVFYGDFRAVKDVSLQFRDLQITALIGPSGCGKSTVLRSFNRMNDLVPTARVDGEVLFHGVDIYQENVDPVEVRRRVGMVFQKPNPFPKSIYDNVAWGAKVNGYQGDMDELVEQSLRQAALWDEVKDKLDQSGLSLSGGQQQRLCIARTIAVKPEIILMD
jgi:phosphate transport system ATP-binding protein